MASKRENFDVKKVPLRSFKLRSLSIANKTSLKQKLMAELALVRSAVDKVEGYISRTEQCGERASNNTNHCNSTTKQQLVPANRKRKSPEIATQVQKKVKKNTNTISNIAHLNSEANPNKVLSEITNNIDSKNSTACALRKKQFSDSNGFAESLYEKLISPTKALRAAKLKSRFADTILKAQLELQNIGLKERAFRMQREKDILTKAYQEEQIRIEAQIKTAAQKEKSDLKMKIQKEREASRLALEKMETTVEMNDFNQVMKDLKEIGCQNISFYVLRQLGLFLKEDDFDDQKNAHISILANDEMEEGEIY